MTGQMLLGRPGLAAATVASPVCQLDVHMRVVHASWRVGVALGMAFALCLDFYAGAAACSCIKFALSLYASTCHCRQRKLCMTRLSL